LRAPARAGPVAANDLISLHLPAAESPVRRAQQA
jgi:hypothetical protein